jgi:hypothetical protein
MAKRSFDVDKSERVEKKEEKTFLKRSSSTITVQSLRDKIINYTGRATGKKYRFEGAGAVVDMDEKDAEILLAKMSEDCCPGGSGPQPLFARL